jgi:hypothetical protein
MDPFDSAQARRDCSQTKFFRALNSVSDEDPQEISKESLCIA